ncbi:MAG: hypothetical protein ACJ8C4_02940 [Gemmataceae bacterium]
MARQPMEELDDYSRVLVPIILARFPAWEPFAKLSPRPDGAGNVVEFNVPCPSRGAESGLWVSTADEELSVGFHTHHSHFTNYDDCTNRETIEAGLDYAAAIFEDRVGVLSYYSGSKFVGSSSVELPHRNSLPDLYEDMGLAEKLLGTLPPCDRVTLRCWSGRFDRDEIRA